MRIKITLFYLCLGVLLIEEGNSMNLTLPENKYEIEKHGVTFHWEAINRTDGVSEMVFFVNSSKKMILVSLGWGPS